MPLQATHGCAPDMAAAPHTAPHVPPQLDKSFGFDTAVEQAQLALLAAKTEASSALRGIGLVKVRRAWWGSLVICVDVSWGEPDESLGLIDAKVHT